MYMGTNQIVCTLPNPAGSYVLRVTVDSVVWSQTLILLNFDDTCLTCSFASTRACTPRVSPIPDVSLMLALRIWAWSVIVVSLSSEKLWQILHWNLPVVRAGWFRTVVPAGNLLMIWRNCNYLHVGKISASRQASHYTSCYSVEALSYYGDAWKISAPGDITVFQAIKCTQQQWPEWEFFMYLK